MAHPDHPALIARLDGLYDELDKLDDLRDRGYSVVVSEIANIKCRIGELEALKKALAVD